MDLPTVLQHMGFPGKEADVYITALQLGMQPASIIAEKLNLNRVTTYATLKKLVERGLAHTTTRNNMQYFSVETPAKLLQYGARKEEEWRQLQDKLKVALEDLPPVQDFSMAPVRAVSYQGLEGCKTLFLEALTAQKLVLVLNPEGKPEAYRDLWFSVFFNKLLERMPASVHIFTTPWVLDHALIERLEDAGAEVYLLERMPFTMDLVLCDDTKSAFIAENNGILSGALLEASKPQDSLHDFLTRTLSSLAGGFNFLVTPA